MPLASRTGEVKYRIKGKPGADAYNLITTVSQVYQTATGTFNPNSFTAYAYQGKELAIGMYLQCWGSSDNENWTYISYRQITSSNTGLTVNVSNSYKYYIVRLYDHNPSTNIDAEPYFFASATIPVIKDGEPGAQGNPGAKMRMRTWASGTYYMRGVGTEEWYDVVEYEGRLYLCRVSHTASTSNSPATDTGYWESAQNWTFIATKLLLAERIKADMIDADGITAKGVDIEGKITATSGTFNNVNITGTLKTPWRKLEYEVIYSTAEVDVWGFNGSGKYDDKLIVSTIFPSAELLIAWGDNAEGREMIIYVKGQSVEIKPPAGKKIIYGNTVYDSNNSMKLSSSSIYRFYGFADFWVVKLEATSTYL